jgi:hypothetical protein
MLDSTLDYIYSVSPELGDKLSEYERTGYGDESTEKLVSRLEQYEIEDNEWWLSDDPNVIAYWQLHEPFLLIDFETFHEYVEQFLDRGVTTFEFGVATEELRQEADARREELGYF